MGITKIKPIKVDLNRAIGYASNAEKTEYTDMQNVLHYASDEGKVITGPEKTMYVSTLNCHKDRAYQDMMETKRYYDKTGGNVAYHCIQSFKTGEVTPELCHKLGVELARQMWGEEYQVLIATHFNTGTYHNHLVINSVSFKTGKKFNCNIGAYYRLRSISDELCREHHLTVIEHPKGKVPRNIYLAEKRGEPTTFNLLRQAIDYAITVSNDMERFGKVLWDLGYVLQYDENRKYPTIRFAESRKSVRLFRLGEEYSIERIRERMNERSIAEKYQCQFWYKEDRQKWQKKHPLPKQYTALLQAVLLQNNLILIYLLLCLLLGLLPKQKRQEQQHRRKPFSPAFRLELKKFAELTAQMRLLCREGLETVEQVEQFISKVQEKIQAVEKERIAIYNKLRRCQDPESIADLKAERDKCTKTLHQLRKDKKKAQLILEKTPERCKQIQCEIDLRQRLEPKSRTRKYDRER